MIKKLDVNVIIRPPEQEELEAIFELCTLCDSTDCGEPDTPLEQLQASWHAPAFRLETDAWVAVTPEKQIVAYAHIQRHRPVRLHFEIRVHPDYRELGIGDYLLTLVEARAAELLEQAPADYRVSLQSWLHAGNLAGHTLLESRLYKCIRHTLAMMIDLLQEPETPVWPEGITLRPFVVERDARAVFEADDEAFQDHWGHLPGIYENWYQRHFVNNKSFDPSLWFIAMDGEEIAGCALCGYYLQDGFVNILGVRRPWRRRGLGLTLLHHAFGEFYRRGAPRVTLGVDAQSLTGATRLYERAGMYVGLRYDTYEKELRAGIDESVQALDS